MGSIVAIVGRPNVGKSTLFNRLTETKTAIVDEISGVTRDRQYGQSTWNGKDFTIVDTGGWTIKSDDVFEEEIKKQVKIAINEADAILFLVDVQNGITDLDMSVANMLRKEKKRVFVVVNKVDDGFKQHDSYEFFNLGLGDYYNISAINGSGTGELLDALAKILPETVEVEKEKIPHIAIVGRPNVGKSSLINALTEEDRHIVTPIAGTTRDAVGARYTKFGHDFYFIDTAGLRKKEKVHEDLEFYSVLRSIRALETADVCLLLIDARDGIESQDMNIMHLVIRNNKGVVVCVNKWDLIAKETNTARDFEKILREKMAPFNDVPIIFTSVLEKVRLQKILEKAQEVYENRSRRISTAKLNEFMQEAVERFHPPSVKGKLIKIKYATQLPTPFPAFAFFCSNPKYVKESYKRYLENKLREAYNFEGVPIRIYMREK